MEKEHELAEVGLVVQVGNKHKTVIYNILPFEVRKVAIMMFDGVTAPIEGNTQRIYLSNHGNEYPWMLGNEVKFTAELEII